MTPKTTWLFHRLLSTILLFCLLSACTPSSPEPVPTIEVTRLVTQIVTPTGEAPATPPPLPTPDGGGPTLRVALNVYPATLDPQKADSAEEQAVLRLMYEGLTQLDETLQPQPGAAESWAVSPDGLTVDFKLRANLRYSNGAPLNALRFVYALKRALNPRTAGPLAWLLDDVTGAQAWRTADVENTKPDDLVALEAGVSIHALDANGKDCRLPPEGYAQPDCLTVRFELDRASGRLLTVLALPVAYPAPQESVEDQAASANWWQNSRLQIGNGPFTLARLEPYVHATLTRSLTYWRGQARLSEIDVTFLAKPEEALVLYRAGQLDIAPLSADDLSAVRDDRALQAHVHVYPGYCTVAYFFNLASPPFDNIGVRRAVAQAVDRAAWVAEIDQGLGRAADGWIPPGLPGAEPPVAGWPFDPAAARDALAQAGYPAGAGLPAIRLVYPATARGKSRAEFLAAQLLANLDVRARLEPLEPDAYTAAVESQASLPPLYRVGYCPPYPDPAAWLDPFFRAGSESALRQGYANGEVDALLAQAYGEYDAEARARLYQQAQQQVIRDLPLVVLDNIANAYLVRPEVTGVVYTPEDRVLPGLYAPLSIDVAAAP